jgi:hypothetical protein
VRRWRYSLETHSLADFYASEHLRLYANLKVCSLILLASNQVRAETLSLPVDAEAHALLRPRNTKTCWSISTLSVKERKFT